MTLLLPLGLLGLAAIIALLVIYFIKPNYQQKFISSTFVWKLSLKYKKRRIPINKLRNLLLIICQVLILVACALILAQPAQVLKTQQDKPEVIAIIDSSASMRAQLDGETRYERAVQHVHDLTDDVFARNGMVSVILAEEKPSLIAQRLSRESKNQLDEEFEKLLEDELGCTYGAVDINKAIMLCEDILSINPDALVYVYTDAEYNSVPDSVEVVNVSEDDEWNAAILSVDVKSLDNFYYFEVDVACYGRNEEIELNIEIYDANAANSNSAGRDIKLTASVRCEFDQTVKVCFVNDGTKPSDEMDISDRIYVEIDNSDRVYAYKRIHVSLANVNDSYNVDNNFDIYNGQKEVVRVQYATQYETPTSNPFFPAALLELQRQLKSKWDIQITEVKNEEAATEGFDFYLYEHRMPDKIPTDGVVLLSDPDKVPAGVNIDLGTSQRFGGDGLALLRESDDSIINYFNAGAITLTNFTEITYYDSSYKVLLSCDAKPVMLVKDDNEAKIVIMPFSIHMSNLPIRPETYILLYNMFERFIPATVNGNAFEVNESITLRSRGDSLTISGIDEPVTEFPSNLKLERPGTYTITQTTFFGKDVIEDIFVRTPVSESNIKKTEDVIRDPYTVKNDIDFYRDLIIYFAAALVALLFIEWLLQMRDM